MNLDELSLKATSLLRRTGLVNVSKHALIGIAAIGLVLVVLAIWHFWPHESKDFIASSNTANASTDSEIESSSEASQATSFEEIIVDIEGAVHSPGLYTMPSGSRIGDVVEAAGGMTLDAANRSVNLAQIVNDGDQVIIYTKEEIQTQSTDQDNEISDSASSNTQSGSPTISSNGKININTASATELQQLSGVGPSLSERIIQYRDANGKFKSLDELKNVSGIGETRFANIKDKICI